MNQHAILSKKIPLDDSQDKFDFSTFKNLDNQKFKDIPDSFLEWLIGFYEGDGCFTITWRKDMIFVITQGVQNKSILEEIQQTLGFGAVIKQGARTFRFVVQDFKNMRYLLHLFNGNLILPNRKKIFLNMLIHYNEKMIHLKKRIKSPKNKFYTYNLEQIKSKETNILPSLTDSWLSGFTSAEGCFSIFLSSKNNYTNIIFDLTQKGEENLPILSHLILLFNAGAVRSHHEPNCFYFRISSLQGCLKTYSYFDSHPLRTTKQESYFLWKKIHKAILEKEHLIPEKRILLLALSKKINPKL